MIARCRAVFARTIVWLMLALLAAVPSAAAQSLSVTPDEWSWSYTPLREINTTHTAVFTVQNGYNYDTIELTCDALDGLASCTVEEPTTLFLAPLETVNVTVSYTTGSTVGEQRLMLTASGWYGWDYGQWIVPTMRHSIAVTPDGGTTPLRDANTTGHTAVFTVQNTGTMRDTIALSCTGLSGVTCTNLSASSVILLPNASTNVTATYNMGTTTGTLKLTGSDATGRTDDGTFTVPIMVYTVATTPDGAPVGPKHANTSGFSEVFTVQNTGNVADTYTFACSSAGGLVCGTLSQPNATLQPNASTTVTVNYSTGAAGTGTLTLTATSSRASNAGNYSVTVVVPTQQVPVVATDSVNPGPLLERDLCVTVALAPNASAECGDLRITHALPATRTLSKARTPVLLYSAQQGYPMPVIRADVTIPATAIIPDSVVLKLWVCPPGGACLYKTSGKWLGSDWTPGATRRIALSYDAKPDSTNVFRDSLEVANWYGNTPKVAVAGTQHAMVNRYSSYFGRGWWLAGLEQLRPASMVWVGGDGSVRQYTSVATDVWVAPGIDRPDTLKKVGTEYIRYLPEKGQVVFDATGKHVRTVNRLGHTTTFAYSGVKLSSVTLAPAGANKAYNFAYPTGQVTITAPAIDGTTPRVTTVTLNSGRITQITDPDTSVVSFTYGSTTHWIRNRVDRRGVSASYQYDAAWLVSSGGVNIPGTDPIVTLTPAETRGLAGTAAVDTALAFTKINGPRTDAGDTTRVWVNRYGAPRKIANALGHTTLLHRRDTRWPGLVTQAIYPNGKNVSAAYDERGHLVTTTDSSTYLGSPAAYATTAYQWNMPCDAVTQVTRPAGEKVTMAYDATTCNRLWEAPGDLTERRAYFYYEGTWGLLRATLYPTRVGDPVARDSIAYDATTGNVTGTRTPKGYWTTYVADAVGRDTLIGTAIDSADYSPGVGSNKQRQRLRYDIVGQVTRQSTAGRNAAGTGTDSLTVLTFYNREGQVDSVKRRSDPDPNTVGWIKTQWVYDELGRKIKEIAPDGQADTTMYDLAGNVTSYRSRRNLTLTMTYDALNRLTQRTLPLVDYGATTAGSGTFPQYPNNGLGGIRIPQDVQVFDYDNMGNLIRADNADAKVSRTYNTNGTLASETQKIRTWADTTAGGNFTSHVYTLNFAYNRSGQRTRVYHPTNLLPPGLPVGSLEGATEYSYNSYTTGELGGVRELYGQWYYHYYTPGGQLDSLMYPGGLREYRRYDADGNVRLRVERNKPIFGGTYDYSVDTLRTDTLVYGAQGKLLRLRNGGLQRDTARYAYTGLGMLASSGTWMRFEVPNSTGWWSQETTESFTTDALGNLRQMQLASTVRYPNGSTALTTGENETLGYEVGTGRLGAKAPNYEHYDASGNLTWREKYAGAYVQDGYPTDQFNYYGADERLRVADRRVAYLDYYYGPIPAQETFEDYRYDALGRRVLVRERVYCDGGGGGDPYCASKIRRTVWDGAQELWEIQYPGQEGASVATLEQDVGRITPEGRLWGRVLYTHGPAVDRPLGVLRLDYVQSYSNDPYPFDTLGLTLHYNARGLPDFAGYSGGQKKRCTTTSPVVCVDLFFPEALSAYQRQFLRPSSWFGTLLEQKQGPTGQAYRRHRYYDPGTGRFTQEDPIGLAGGINLYGYGNSDPINYSDPFGLSPVTPCLVPPVGIICGELLVAGTAALSGLVYAARDKISAAGGQVVESARTTWQKIKTAVGIGIGLGAGESPPKTPDEEPPPPPEKIAPAPPGGGKSPIEIGPDGIPRMTFPIR